MNVYITLLTALLFFVLTPGVVLTLPKGGDKMTVAAVHALVFAVVYHVVTPMVWKATKNL